MRIKSAIWRFSGDPTPGVQISALLRIGAHVGTPVVQTVIRSYRPKNRRSLMCISQWADLLKAIAALLWPILAFVIFFVLKKEIRDLCQRLKKGKIFGQELELEEKLKEPGQLLRK